jgi:hypothetical protein
MNFVRTVDSVHVVIIPSITGFQTSKSLTVYAATVLFLVLQADAIDKQQTLSDNFKVRHPVLFLYNELLIKNHQHNFILVIFTAICFDPKG